MDPRRQTDRRKKPSFEEKTRFHPHVLGMSEVKLLCPFKTPDESGNYNHVMVCTLKTSGILHKRYGFSAPVESPEETEF